MDTQPAPARRKRRQGHRQVKRVRHPANALMRLVVTCTAGLLFAVTAGSGDFGYGRTGTDIETLVRQKEDVVSDLKAGNQQLRHEVEQLQQKADEPVEADGASTEVVGSGIQVTLSDAPIPEPFPDGLNANDLVIHQQDIEAVMNALLAGGAEAVGVEGMLVTLTTRVSCVGNVMNINGELFSPPYEITAIGDKEALRQALNNDEQVAVINQYVARYNLGYAVKELDEIRLTRPAQKAELQYAKVSDNER